MGNEQRHQPQESVTENISYFFFFYLEVLQDNMITARGLREKMHGGFDTK